MNKKKFVKKIKQLKKKVVQIISGVYLFREIKKNTYTVDDDILDLYECIAQLQRCIDRGHNLEKTKKYIVGDIEIQQYKCKECGYLTSTGKPKVPPKTPEWELMDNDKPISGSSE